MKNDYDIAGRKEITENVVQAVIVATLTGLVGLGIKAIEAAIERRKKAATETPCN